LRVIHQYIPYTRTVHCGYVINAGSRDDLQGEMGMAHFIEHMIFKGTTRRKTFHVLNYLESVGGDVNAYTTKEKTCLYASMMAEYFDRATELLTDITFHSTFPEKEMVKEKQVIAEEIDMYRNTPDEAIFEDFDEMIFPEHSLGHPILGTKDSIASFTQAQLRAHQHRSLVAGQVVFSVVGNVSLREVERVVDKYLRPLQLADGHHQRTAPSQARIMSFKQKVEQDQAHEIIGGRAYSMQDPHYVPFLLLNNLLGGPAMNSRLNLNIREKYGLTYNISSFFAPFLDTGLWGIYFACEKNNLTRIRRLVSKELRQMREKSLGTVRLSQAKKQLMGQMILGYENLLNQMLTNAKDLLDFDRIIPFAQLLEQIEKVTANEIQSVAQDLFQEESFSRITYLAG
ncbi:MAG: pitrilysin family protein, partial [Bacteroidota bacterium]